MIVMDARDTFKIQQQYYYDFSFFPIRGLKKHHHFVYKTYATRAVPQSKKIRTLFDNALNSEVLDLECVLRIGEKIVKASLPLTRQMGRELLVTQNAVVKLLPLYDREWLLYVLETMRTLQRSLFTCEETEVKMAAELKKLLSNKGFAVQYRTSADDIGNAINLLQHITDTIKTPLHRLSVFNRTLPENTAQQPIVVQTQQLMQSLATGLKKWMQLQQLLLQQLRSWKRIRARHELQQVLN
jgi:hypothetical protein